MAEIKNPLGEKLSDYYGYRAIHFSTAVPNEPCVMFATAKGETFSAPVSTVIEKYKEWDRLPAAQKPKSTNFVFCNGLVQAWTIAGNNLIKDPETKSPSFEATISHILQNGFQAKP